MSVKVMGQVWDLELACAPKLVLLAIADHANHDGGRAYPGVDLIAKKTGLDRRSVQRHIRRLEAVGYLVREDGPPPPGIRPDRAPNSYRVVAGRQIVTPSDDDGAAPETATGRQQAPPRGGTVPPEPEDEPSMGTKDTGSGDDIFSSTTETSETNPSCSDAPAEPARSKRRRRSETPLPDDFELTPERRAYAVEKGCQDPEMEFEAFRLWADKNDARYRNWDAVWRTRCLNHRKFPCVGARGSGALPETFKLTPARALVALRKGCHDPAKAFDEWRAFVQSRAIRSSDWDAEWAARRHDWRCPCGGGALRDGREPLFSGDVATLLRLPTMAGAGLRIETVRDPRFLLPDDIRPLVPTMKRDGVPLAADKIPLAVRRAFLAQGRSTGDHPWWGLRRSPGDDYPRFLAGPFWLVPAPSVGAGASDTPRADDGNPRPRPTAQAGVVGEGGWGLL